MSVKLMGDVFYLDGLSPSEKLILLALADNANDSGLCWPSVETIARKSCQSERTVQRVLARLEKHGQIHRQIQRGRSTRYYVTPNQWLLSQAKPTPVKLSPPTRVSPHPRHGCHPNHQGTTKGLLEEDEIGGGENSDGGLPW